MNSQAVRGSDLIMSMFSTDFAAFTTALVTKTSSRRSSGSLGTLSA